MNLILLERADFIANDRVRLEARDPRFQHISEILNLQIGEQLRVGELNAKLGTATIEQRSLDSIDLHVTLDQSPPPKLPLKIILALPRPKMIRRIFRTIAEMGVAELVVINTYKVEKSYWNSPALEPEIVQSYFKAGLQQARDTVMPSLRFGRLFKPFVEDELAEIAAGTRGLVAHPGNFPTCPSNLTEPCTLAIGPEGGFTSYEIQKLEEAGLQSVQIGERILRVETALTALISRLYC